MNASPPAMANNDEQQQETWYSKPLDDKWELSKDDHKIVDNVLQNKTLPSNMAGFIRDADGQPTLYLTPLVYPLRWR